MDIVAYSMLGIRQFPTANFYCKISKEIVIVRTGPKEYSTSHCRNGSVEYFGYVIARV